MAFITLLRVAVYTLLLGFIRNVKSEDLVSDLDDEGPSAGGAKKMFNFASQAAGAIVLDKSPPTAKGYSHLLNDDRDKYGISPCDEKKWVVIGLSEDIIVTSVVMANYERYSSMLKEFQILASASYPTEKWINLGIYIAEPKLGEQTFNISDSSVHARYLKFKFNSHYGSEDLCTLSQIKVHGTTVIASFAQEVERSDSHIRDLLSHLNGDPVAPGVGGDSAITNETGVTPATPISTVVTGVEVDNGTIISSTVDVGGNVVVGAQNETAGPSSSSSDVKEEGVQGGAKRSETTSPATPDGSNVVETQDSSTLSIPSDTAAGGESVIPPVVAEADKAQTDSPQDKASIQSAGGSNSDVAGNVAAEPVKSEASTPTADNANVVSEIPAVVTPEAQVTSTVGDTTTETTEDKSQNQAAVGESAAEPLDAAQLDGEGTESSVVDGSVNADETEGEQPVDGPVDDDNMNSFEEDSTVLTTDEGSEVQNEDSGDGSGSGDATNNNDDDDDAGVDDGADKKGGVLDNEMVDEQGSEPSSQSQQSTESGDVVSSLITAVKDIVTKISPLSSNGDATTTITSGSQEEDTATSTTDGDSDSDGESGVDGKATGNEADKDGASNSDPQPASTTTSNEGPITETTDISVGSSSVPQPDAVVAGADTAPAVSSVPSAGSEDKTTDNVAVDSTVSTEQTNLDNSDSNNVSDTKTAEEAPVSRDKGNDTTERTVKSSGPCDGTGEVDSPVGGATGAGTAAENTVASLPTVSLSTGASSAVPSSVAGASAAATAAAAAGIAQPLVRIVHGLTAGSSGAIGPHCLELLRYSDFHAKMMSKLQQKAAEADRPSATLNAQDNVFRQLMQKIKTLEMNYAIVDMYSAQVSECYRAVLYEVLGNVTHITSALHGAGIPVPTGTPGLGNGATLAVGDIPQPLPLPLHTQPHALPPVTSKLPGDISHPVSSGHASTSAAAVAAGAASVNSGKEGFTTGPTAIETSHEIEKLKKIKISGMSSTATIAALKGAGGAGGGSGALQKKVKSKGGGGSSRGNNQRVNTLTPGSRNNSTSGSLGFSLSAIAAQISQLARGGKATTAPVSSPSGSGGASTRIIGAIKSNTGMKNSDIRQPAQSSGAEDVDKKNNNVSNKSATKNDTKSGGGKQTSRQAKTQSNGPTLKQPTAAPVRSYANSNTTTMPGRFNKSSGGSTASSKYTQKYHSMRLKTTLKPILNLTENELILLVGVCALVAFVSLLVSVIMCVAMVWMYRSKDKETDRKLRKAAHYLRRDFHRDMKGLRELAGYPGAVGSESEGERKDSSALSHSMNSMNSVNSINSTHSAGSRSSSASASSRNNSTARSGSKIRKESSSHSHGNGNSNAINSNNTSSIHHNGNSVFGRVLR